MLTDQPAIAFLPSTDLDRSRRFFADTLGLPVEQDNPFACVLRAGPTMVRVTKVASLTPQPFTVFGWQVPDIGASARRLADAGVELLRFDGMEQDDAGVWTAPGGDQVAWFNDPDRNVLSLTQFTG
jgi:catechol 2,3-dioxygenase-like lactoylglutathione lyase family enzyme